MSACQLCDNQAEICCDDCKETYCHTCGTIKHLRKQNIKDHNLISICDECEEEMAKLFCPLCEQNLCKECDTKIHNKGKRAQHKRKKIETQFSLDNVKMAGFLSIEFIKKYMLEDENDSEKFEERFAELENALSETLVLAEDQYAFYFSFSEPGVIPDDDTLQLQKFLRTIKTRAFFFFFPDDYDDIEKNRPRFLEDLSFDENEDKIMPEMKKASIIYNILKNLKSISYVNVLDTGYNNSLVRILKSIEELRDIRFSLNFAPNDETKQPFSVTQYNPNASGSTANNSNVNNNSNLSNKSRKKHDRERPVSVGDFKTSSYTFGDPSPESLNNMKNSNPNLDSYTNQLLNYANRSNEQQQQQMQSQENPMILQELSGQQHEMSLGTPKLAMKNSQTFMMSQMSNSGTAQQNNSTTNQLLVQKNDSEKGFWEQLTPSKETANQSYDDILLNTSSDQANPKKSSYAKHSKHHYNKKFNFDFTQPYKNVEINNSPKISHLLQQEMIKFASAGELLVSKDEFLEKNAEEFQRKFGADLEDVISKAEKINVLHTTIRKFIDTKPLYYIGLLLDVLTIESLTWIVKSIRNDMMTPTEKLILSRIKECYGLKIEQNFWKNVISYILNAQNDKTPIKTYNSYDNLGIFPLRAQKIQDPVTHADTYVIFLRDKEWEPEDQGYVDENTPEWRAFVNFVEDFFKEDEFPRMGGLPTSFTQQQGVSGGNAFFSGGGGGDTPKPNSSNLNNNSFSQQQQQHQQYSNATTNDTEENKDNASKKNTWSSSVENVLNRSSNKKDKSLKLSEDIRAIPGGRYGCAQFIKICGPEVLKKLSIGRLTLFVQESINKGILRYQRTLLVKNNPNDSVMSALTEGNELNDSMSMNDPQFEKKSKEIKQIKDALIQILSENPEGISLAQIPLHLRKSLDFPINFQQLGFPKLKNFLVTMADQIKIESSGTNHSFAMLKNPPPKQSNGGSQSQGQQNILGQPSLTGSNMGSNAPMGLNSSFGNTSGDLQMTNTVLSNNKSNPTRNPMFSQLQQPQPLLTMTNTTLGHSRSANAPSQGMQQNNANANSKKNLIYRDQSFNPDFQNPNMQQQQQQQQQQQGTNPNTSQASNMMASTSVSGMGSDRSEYTGKHGKKFNTLTPQSEAKNVRSGRKKVSTLDDYLNKVKGLIELILQENCYGISIQKLYKELCTKLGFEFDARMFNCNDFNEFLLNNAENLVDIEIKRNALLIYPKNFRFGPQTLASMVNNNQQRTPVKGPEGYDQNSANKQFFPNYPNQFPQQQQFGGGHMKSGSGELETPPGLGKQAPKTSFGLSNGSLGQNQYAQFLPHSNQKIPPNKNEHNSNPAFNISPINFYGGQNDDDNMATPDKNSPTHNRSISYWNLNFGGNNPNFEQGGVTISNLNTAIHSRNDSRVTAHRHPEESNLEIRENLKFIEELLNDGGGDSSAFTNFTGNGENSFHGFQSPNISFTGIPGIYANSTLSKNNHGKTQSEDFSNKQNLVFQHGGHGRAPSAFNSNAGGGGDNNNKTIPDQNEN